MRIGKKLIMTYFDLVYNPVYDFTTAQLASYHRLQTICVEKFEFGDGDRVLCVGVGTGNEILHILGRNSNVSIVGVDYSDTALKKVYKKALTRGKEIEVLAMDAQALEFAIGSFDKVLCLHVMDFIPDDEKATAEIVRVLRDGGQFVITYPSDKEGVKFGVNLLRDSIRHNINSGKFIRVLPQLLVQIVVGLVYLPLLFRPRKRFYSRRELETMFTKLTSGDFQLEEYSVYNDFIVYGRK